MQEFLSFLHQKKEVAAIWNFSDGLKYCQGGATTQHLITKPNQNKVLLMIIMQALFP